MGSFWRHAGPTGGKYAVGCEGLTGTLGGLRFEDFVAFASCNNIVCFVLESAFWGSELWRQETNYLTYSGILFH